MVLIKKILFLHGFYASGQCVPAEALRTAFEGKAEVLTPKLTPKLTPRKMKWEERLSA